MTQTSIEINGEKIRFSQIWDGRMSWNFKHSLKCENEYISNKSISWDYSPSIYNLQFCQI